MSKLNDELDRMDKSLDDLEHKVSTDNENNNTLDYIYDAQALVDEDEDLVSVGVLLSVSGSALLLAHSFSLSGHDLENEMDSCVHNFGVQEKRLLKYLQKE